MSPVPKAKAILRNIPPPPRLAEREPALAWDPLRVGASVFSSQEREAAPASVQGAAPEKKQVPESTPAGWIQTVPLSSLECPLAQAVPSPNILATEIQRIQEAEGWRQVLNLPATLTCSAQLPPDNVAFASRQATRGYRKDCRRRGRLRSGLSPCAASICGCQARVGAEQLKLQQQPFEHRLRNSAAGTSTGFETWRTDQQIFWEYSASATTRCSAAKVTTLPSSHASVWLGSTWSSSSTASKCRCVAHCFSRLTTGRCLTVLGTSSSFSMLT